MHRDSKYIFESYKALKEQSLPGSAYDEMNNAIYGTKQNTNIKQQQTQDIVNQIKNEQAEMAKVLAVIQGSNLSADVKKAMQQLLQNGNVLTIYKQIKGLPAGYEKDPDLVNLQPGSVSEPGTPNALQQPQGEPIKLRSSGVIAQNPLKVKI